LSENISADKEKDISYSDRKHFELWLENLDSGLQVEEKTVKYSTVFFEKSCKDIQTGEIRK
jgi:hypothetical protein